MPGCAASAAPASSPVPVTTLSAPAGKAGVFGDAREGERGQARLFRGLHHRRIAGRECAHDGAADDLHGIVPGNDVRR